MIFWQTLPLELESDLIEDALVESGPDREIGG
jgi:hypothetical protein